MLDENELLFDEFYEKIKDCGRVQFINLLIAKERENQELKDQLSNSHQIKTQQKEFIELLENEIALRERKTYEIAIIKDDTAVFVWKIKLELLKEVLSKYKELIGVKDE